VRAAESCGSWTAIGRKYENLFFLASLLGITRHLPEHIAVKKSFGRKFIPSFSHFFVTKCPVDEQTQLELYVGAAW